MNKYKTEMVMKRLLTMMVMAACSQVIAWAQASMSGSGTESDPYKIYYPDQLHQVRNYLNQSGVVFKLMTDIDITEWNETNNPGQGWEPIGVASAPFKGVFDGNGKQITGFSITRSSTDYVGFFGYVSGATIKNLTISGPVAGKNYVGAFVGKGDNTCTLTNLTHIGATTGASYVGGIAGYCQGNFQTLVATGNVTATADYVGGAMGFHGGTGTVYTGITVTGDVKSTSSSAKYTGGIIGYTLKSLSNAMYSGTVTGKSYVGGIVGSTSNNISSANASGSVSGSTMVGGICGEAWSDASLSNCYSRCDVTATGDYVGGILGTGIVDIIHCSSFGSVSGASYVGGVIGGHTNEINNQNNLILYSYFSKKSQTSSSSISTYDEVGELAFKNKSISNCYAVGNVTGTGNYVGGILGYYPNGLYWGREYKSTITLYSNYYSHSVRYKGNYYDGEGEYTTYNYIPTESIYTLADNYFSGDLQGKNYVGGIVGLGGEVVVKRNYSNANISGNTYVGGIIGRIEANTGSLTYYPYDSSSSRTSFSSEPRSELKSNMAINASVVATSDAGRIYGSKKASGVTVGVNGNASEDNRALYEGSLVVSGVTQTVSDSEQNGVNNGAAYFKLKANYKSHGWDFNDNWTNLETECYPYKPWQAAPPTITTGTLVSGNTSISGGSTDGGTVYVKIGKNMEQSTVCSGTAWTLSGLAVLQSGADVSAYTMVSGKENSYRTLATVGFPGSGTEADPWRVYSAADLQGVYKAGYYKQMNDIDLASWISTNSKTAGWVPVGYSGTEPVVYDGDGHKVTGLWVNTTADNSGLFSSFTKGTIRNLTVEATAKQVKGGNYVGIVIGRIGEGTIENVTAKGNVSAKGYVGGIAGYTDGTSLKGLSYTGQLTATGHVGGITSYANTGTISECTATDVVIKASASTRVGGLIGNSLASVSHCSATGSITLTGTHAGAYVGGLVGANGTGKTISECFTNVTISSASQNGYTAGLVPYNYGTITRCYTAGSVSSTGTGSYVGGLVANTGTGSVIEDCFSTADVSGNMYTAGLVAYNYGTVERCYASGNVNSVYYGAGLVSQNDGASAVTTNCVALNPKIEVSDQTGWGIRVVGNFANGAAEPDKENLLAWKDMQVSVNGVAKTVSDNNLDGAAITTAETQSRDTYEALYWDFDEVWSMDGTTGYPCLTWVANANKITGVSLDRQSLTVEVGTTGTLTASIRPAAAAGSTLVWSSSNEQVATVVDGVVTGVSLGTAVITVTAADDNNITATCQVTVVANRAEAIAALRSLVSEAQALYDNSTEGDEPGEYSTDVRRALQTAITSANANISDSMTLDEVEETRSDLEAAMETFRNSVNGVGEDTDISQLENAIYIEPFKARAGSTVNVEVKLKNADDIAAYSFDLTLPEGASLAKNAKGKFVYTLNDERHDEHSGTVNQKSDNLYSVAVLSLSGGEMTGNDGTIISFSMIMDESMEEGTYPVVISTARYGLPDGQMIEVPTVKTSLTIENVLVGDVNNNGGIDIGDAVCIVNHIVGKTNAVFVEQAADMNGNGTIGEIGDAVSVVNIIVGKTTASASRQSITNFLDPQ